MSPYRLRPYRLPACPWASATKWRNSVGLGANRRWSTYPSRDTFIPNTSLAISRHFLAAGFMSSGCLCATGSASADWPGDRNVLRSGLRIVSSGKESDNTMDLHGRVARHSRSRTSGHVTLPQDGALLVGPREIQVSVRDGPFFGGGGSISSSIDSRGVALAGDAG